MRPAPALQTQPGAFSRRHGKCTCAGRGGPVMAATYEPDVLAQRVFRIEMAGLFVEILVLVLIVM